MKRTIGFVLGMACVLAAMSASPALAAAGGLDGTFGGDGKVTTNFNVGPAAAAAVAIQADGKVVAAGAAGNRFAITRYTAGGALDTSFGGDGRVITWFPGGANANAVAIQANGKIVAAGAANSSSGSPSRVALVRYNSNGTLDTSFGGDGKVTTRFKGAVAHGVAIQANGKIVAVGGGGESPGFAVARYRANGTLDTSFGGDGKVTNGFELGFGPAYGVAIQADGKIVAAGVVDYYGFALARYNHYGALDTSFGGDGQVSTTVGLGEGGATSVAIQGNGKIVAAGSTDGPHQAGDTFGPGRFAVARYRADGRLDATFGGDGKATTMFGTKGSSASGVAIDGHGKILAVGSSGGGTRFAVARYDLEGRLDRTFSLDGKVTTPFKPGGAVAYGVAIQEDRKIVAAGWSGQGFALAQYLGA